jgi:anti-sigma regulatory factor (Ser/Thr protein kinase)
MAGGWNRPGSMPGPDGPAEVWPSRRIVLPPAGRAAGLARLATRDVLAAWQLAGLADTAVLLVSELVTNSVRHACTSLALCLEIAGTSLRIEVHDHDPRRPQPRTPDGLEESGFGLVLVDALASKWGVYGTATGKAVWAELRLR